MRDFHHTHAYLDRLPQGLASHPQCSVKASIYRAYLDRHALSPAQLDGLPEPLIALVRDPVPVSTWIPATQSLAMTMIVRDLVAPEDEAFVRLVRAATGAMYQSRMYKILMAAMNPARLLRAGSLRWGKFNRGSTMTVDQQGPNTASVEFRYPENLYSPGHYAGLEGAYLAALEVAGASSLRSERDPKGPSGIAFRFSWE